MKPYDHYLRQMRDGLPCVPSGEIEGIITVLAATYPDFESTESCLRLRAVAETAGNTLSALQAILPYAENELASLQEAQRRDGGLEREVAACEQAVEQARAVIEQMGRAV